MSFGFRLLSMQSTLPPLVSGATGARAVTVKVNSATNLVHEMAMPEVLTFEPSPIAQEKARRQREILWEWDSVSAMMSVVCLECPMPPSTSSVILFVELSHHWEKHLGTSTGRAAIWAAIIPEPVTDCANDPNPHSNRGNPPHPSLQRRGLSWCRCSRGRRGEPSLLVDWRAWGECSTNKRAR